MSERSVFKDTTDGFKFRSKTNTINHFLMNYPNTRVVVMNESDYNRTLGLKHQLPVHVYTNEPYVITIWDDGTKSIVKCGPDDEYDPMIGIIFNAMRKVTKNKVRVNAWEPVISFLADNLIDADDCRMIADVLLSTADCLECEDVMDRIAEYDKRIADTEFVSSKYAFIRDEKVQQVQCGSKYVTTEELEDAREQLRSELRDLIDRGEI